MKFPSDLIFLQVDDIKLMLLSSHSSTDAILGILQGTALVPYKQPTSAIHPACMNSLNLTRYIVTLIIKGRATLQLCNCINNSCKAFKGEAYIHVIA